MRLGGRLAAAIEVLDEIVVRHRPAADALKDWGASHRFAGSGDRAAIGNIVYDALRRRRSAGWLLESDAPRALAFGALLLEWGETPASLAAALEGDRFAPQPLTGPETAILSARDPETIPDAVRADCPDWCVPLLEAAWGPGWVAEAAALATRPPLDLRVNRLKAEPGKVAAALASVGAEPVPGVPDALRIAAIAGGGRHPNVQADPAFLEGWFEVQDAGSQMAALLAGAQSGMQVLDLCAGAGGKTLAMAAAMGNTGQIFAHDADKQRLAPIVERLKRAGCRNVQVVGEAGPLAALDGQMDLVLVDAPCTGSGTWRRRPDAKWRLTDRQLAIRTAEQAGILDAAARKVRPGGRLVYVTCSVFAEENEHQAAAFLERHGDFEPEDHAGLWQATFDLPSAMAAIDPRTGIRLSPARTQTDGFFVAALRRAGRA